MSDATATTPAMTCGQGLAAHARLPAMLGDHECGERRPREEQLSAALREWIEQYRPMLQEVQA